MDNLIKTFATLILLCVATITFAQSTKYVRSFTNVKFLIEKLDLTDQQAKRVHALLEEQDKQLKELRNGDTERGQMLTVVNEIRSNTNNSIKSVLNADQLEIFNQLLSQKKGKRDLRSGRDTFMDMGMGTGNLIKKLNLTETQILAYNSIMREQALQVKSVREGMDLNENRAALRSKILEIKKATQEKIKKILDEDQLALYNEFLNKKANSSKLNQE